MGKADTPGVDLKHAIAAAQRYLAFSQRTTAELRARLAGRGISPGVIEQVVERITARGYLDDRKFCQEWLEGRLRRHPVGPMKAIHNLQQRGIPESLAREAVEDFFQRYKEIVVARTVAESKLKTRETMKPASLCRFLSGRGFTREVVLEVVAELTGQEVGW